MVPLYVDCGDEGFEDLLYVLKAGLPGGSATAPPGRLGPRASVTNVRIPTDAIDQILPTGWLRKAHLFMRSKSAGSRSESGYLLWSPSRRCPAGL